MLGGWVRDISVGLGLLTFIASGCARDSQALPVRSAAAATTAQTTPPPTPAKPRPKPDVKDPDACQRAREELKQLEQKAALGCTTDDECLLDADCLIRTTAADTAEIREARMAMEGVCSGTIDRLSCIEGPARCASGRCAAAQTSSP